MDMPKKEIFNEIWNFYKKHLSDCKNDDAWPEIIVEAGDIAKKYNDPFANDMLQTMLSELGRVQKG